ncbi:MAG: PaaI family thioesterase [Halobacteriales archaeon]|nr:PaaI family thioesterase [Halobacteriales archaeon]
MSSESPQRFSDSIGLRFTEMDEGRSRGVVEVTDDLKNPHGVVHGGVLYTMADTGMGAAVYTQLDADESCATIEVKTNYLKPVEDGEVVCETEVVNKGRSVAYLESELTNDGETVARATGSYSVFTVD